MSQSYSSLNFDGQMRVDANHAGNPQYVPNSYAHKFRPDAAEPAFQVADNICSRKSHYWHEGKKSEYAQARELWARVMSDEQRANTCANTGKFLNLCNQTLIRKKYLAQIHNIAPEYARGVYDQLRQKDFEFAEVEQLAETAQVWYKEEKFRPSEGDRLVGFQPACPVYGA